MEKERGIQNPSEISKDLKTPIPTHTPIYQKYRLKLRCKYHPIFRRALRMNYTPMFKEFLTSRIVHYLQNVILSIYGEPGTGKSYVGWSIGEHITFLSKPFYPYVDFNETNVELDLGILLEKLKKAQKGETFMLDEQTQFFGTGSQYVTATITNIEMTVRKNQVNLIYCAPIIRAHYHNLVLETFMTRWAKQRKTVCEKGYIPYGKTYCFVYGQDTKNYLDPLGKIIVNHPKNLQALRKYEKKKDEFIQAILEGQSINLTAIKDNVIKKFRELDPVYYSKNDIITVIKMNKLLPDGAPNTLIKEIADQIDYENKQHITRKETYRINKEGKKEFY